MEANVKIVMETKSGEPVVLTAHKEARTIEVLNQLLNDGRAARNPYVVIGDTGVDSRSVMHIQIMNY